MSGDQPRREASGAGCNAACPPPQRAYNGGKEAIEIQRRTREASRSCGVAPFNRVFDGCAQRGQHDCDRSHIRVGAAVPIRSQAMVVTGGAL
jgi:hypothetical protein